MKLLVVKLVFILALGNPEAENSSKSHASSSGDINLATLNKIECLIRKKAGAELEKNNENSFELNGYDVYTEVIARRYGPTVYEEGFYEIQNPDNEYRIRLVKNITGDWELAVMIHEKEGYKNYHACFDEYGNMLAEDPWGREEEYSIKVFELYEKYRNLFSQKVDARK